MLVDRQVLVALMILSSISLVHATPQQRIKVEGYWQDGRISVHKVKERNPNKDPRKLRMLGQVQSVDVEANTLTIAGIRFSLRAQPESIQTVAVGSFIEVDAYRTQGPIFEVAQLRKGDGLADRAVEVIGSVESWERQGVSNRLVVGGIPVYVPVHLYSNGRIRLRRLDDRRPSEQLNLSIGNVIAVVGGEIEFSSVVLMDHDLAGQEDDEAQFETSMDLEAFFDINQAVSGYLEIKWQHEVEYDLPWSRDEDSFEFRRGESWFYFDRPFDWPVSLQVGRQNFAEEREWWWDTDLDAIRVLYNTRRWSLEAAIARELGREGLNQNHGDADDEKVTRLLGAAQWRQSSLLNMDFFLLRQWDDSSSFTLGQVARSHREDEDDADLTWWGARASGGTTPWIGTELRYWSDLGFVSGDETTYDFDDLDNGRIFVDEVTQQKRKGWAMDLGLSLTWQRQLEPTLTVGYARGSGDDDSNGTYRETGLNDYSDKFNGVSRFRYYGELSRPELSNLQVTTVALGLRLGGETSLEILHHNYRQLQVSRDHSLRIDQDANGRSGRLGNELNAVFSIEEWEHWELEVVADVFLPDEAFDEDKDAWRFSFKLNYNF